jgi:ketol-acid reductoisomerase
MPERIISKANALGGAINSWFKIAAIIMSIIGYGFLTYYQIKSNSAGINEMKLLTKEHDQAIQKEFKLWADRSDKRFTRAKEMYQELAIEDTKSEKEREKLRDQNFELAKELSYIKGKLDEQDRNR